MQSMGTSDDVASAAEYRASELSGFVSGQHLVLSGEPQPEESAPPALSMREHPGRAALVDWGGY